MHQDTRIVSVQALTDYAIRTLLACGMREEDARTTADVLVTTDMWGINTHGTKQLYNYTGKIKAGGIDPLAVPKVIKDGPAWATIDGCGAMAMVSSCAAMKLAMEKARQVGFAYVGVKGSTHFGAAGYYANLAAREDMIGLAMSTTETNMTVPGARGNVIGNNPFSYAVPAGEEYPILLDIAFSVVAAAKVYAAVAKGEPVPDGWFVDDEGVPTNDVSGYPQHGTLLPMAGHKGYGLSLMVEVFAGALTGALMTKDIPQWIGRISEITDEGHAFIAVDIGALMPTETFKARIDHLIRGIKSSPKAKGSDRIYVPGEMEWERYYRAKEQGIPLSEQLVAGLNELAEKLGVAGLGAGG